MPILNSGDLRVVYNELFKVRAKWRRIGIELNLAPGTLDAIQMMPSSRPADWLENVLTEWLNKETATWRELIDALKSVPVGETKLARQLEQKYCRLNSVVSNSVLTGNLFQVLHFQLAGKGSMMMRSNNWTVTLNRWR